jgi:ABC-type branched-subunit amino acid transport system substrate-binding protein
MSILNAGRRHILRSGAGIVAASTAPAAVWAQSPKGNGRTPMVAQIVDVSTLQQDVSKDFLIGSRAAWQDINGRAGARGRTVQHLAIETDGSPESLRAALTQARDNPACVALSGTVAAVAASQLAVLLRAENLSIAHAAPWLQDAAEVDERTFPIFANRQDQIVFAVKSLANMGVRDLGAIYATPQDFALQHLGVERTAAALQVRLQSFQAGADALELGQRLTPGTPAILLFVGGTPELARFTQGLEKQSRQRYLVALADVNLQVLTQMGAARNTPVINTQPVPMVTASLPVVRAYREVMGRLFDEPPSQLSLAGFLAARYTNEVLDEVDGPLTRASVLAAFQRRTARDMGGYRISFNPQRFGSTYVTQSMLTTDGRVIG